MTFWDRGQSLQQKEIDVTHHLTPAPITGHYIMETVVTIEVILLMRDVVKFIAEVQILKHVVNQLVRISIPNIPFGLLPICCVRGEVLVGWTKAQIKSLPIRIASRDRCGVNHQIQLLMIFERRHIVVRS